MARFFGLFLLLSCLVFQALHVTAEVVEEVPEKTDEERVLEATATQQEAPESTEHGEDTHAQGSVCSYCTYCKFCKLCEKDCPCTTSKSKPNCHMCKYCKYCNLCSTICDTICLPGGFLDTVSSSIWNSLPTFDTKMKDAVDKDLDSVKDWIKEYL